MKRKLAPALAALHRSGNFPDSVLAIGRKPMTSEEYRSYLKDTASAPAGGFPDAFLARLEYLGFAMDDPSAYGPLQTYAADRPDAEFSFYLSVPPELFEPVTVGIAGLGLGVGRSRIGFEKPFGSDLESARSLNAVVTCAFPEDRIFRVDHYVGKEAVQNVLAFRFANSIFEPLWNYRYVDNIQITAFESLGVESRGEYYDRSGAIRDMVQNHLFQMLSLAAMEPPHDLGSDSLHDEKAKVVRSLRFGKDLASHVVFGQYRGYREESGVTPDSRTETFAALRLEVHNWRFKGVPVYLRTGKALDSKRTRVVVEFKHVPHVLFNESENAEPNRIVFEASPREGISVEFNVRDPLVKGRVKPVRSEFLQEDTPEAYERILSDFLAGDRTLFTRWDMIEESWRLVDELVHCKDDCPILHSYDRGGPGPSAADELIAADGRSWF